MTPVGHAALSYLISRGLGTRGSVRGCMLGGILPDLDFVLLPFPCFNGLHRVVSHNVFFVLAGALIASRWVHSRKATFIACVLCCGIFHLLVDSVMDTNPTNGIGVAMFWPVSDTMISPFNLFTPDPAAEGWSNVSQSLMKALPYLVLEIPLWIGAVVVAWARPLRLSSSETQNAARPEQQSDLETHDG